MLNSKKTYIQLLLQILLVFLKISPVTFGGGFAMIPLLEKEIIEKKKWMNQEKMANTLAVAQSVPGAVGVNSAIYIGYQIAGIPGALVAMLGIVLPTFIIIILLAVLFTSIQDNIYVQSALKGIRPAIIALIAAAAVKMGKVSLLDRICWFLCSGSVAILFFLPHLSIIYLILFGIASGISITRMKLYKP